MVYRLFLQGIGVIWLLSISHIVPADINKVTEVNIWPYSSHTRITLESNSELKYKRFILGNPRRLVLDCENTSFNSVLKNVDTQIYGNDPYIKSIRIGQLDLNTLRIVFDLKQRIKVNLFTLAPINNFKERLILDFYPINTNFVCDPLLMLLEDHKNESFQDCTILKKKNQQYSKVKYNHPIIMLDPGHGGEDFGAIGKYHTREKDVVLQIAHYLRKCIEKENNMQVFMTRDEDVFIPLQERVAKAQKRHADLFISIHTDAFTSRKSSGSSVFSLSTKENNNIEEYLVNTQNSSDFIRSFSKNNDIYLYYTILDMVQYSTIKDSIKFGKAVLNRLGKINKLHKNSVEQAGFVVLRALDIPSILVEAAFISNIEEERKLKTAKFQHEIAESILAGIKSYFSNSVNIIQS